MKRYTFAMEIKKGQMGNYRRKLGEIWTDVTDFLDRNGITNFSLWSCGQLVFGYCEAADEAVHGQEEVLALADRMGDTFRWISAPGQEMRLMYENIGVVREKKELIRHRVFMTKLKPGCEEIYKARHDALSAERTGTDPGPDSNFTIWSAGGYIFGYDEIDITMETQEPEEAHAASVEWEKRQLEIMDWVTNDMDWLTGEYHLPCVRLAWHG